MTLNLLLEKMFAIEWFWLAFLLTMSLINMISWAVKIKPPCSTILFSKKYMKVLKYYYTTDTTGGNKSSLSYSLEEFGSSLKGFTEDYLKSDGVFVLRLLELNASRVVVSDVVGHLWSHYLIMNSCKLLSYTKDISNNNNNDSEKTQIDMDESVVIVTDSIL
uniref:Innexin n=1 Tax=Arion vulgaris TaxID=1028688 RepID=A0A0B6ZMB5_9EUPU